MGIAITIILIIMGIAIATGGFGKKSKPNEECMTCRESASNLYESTREASGAVFEQKAEPKKPDTPGLMSDALVEIGCQPTANGDGTLLVKYQGENFVMDFGGRYVRIWDMMWAGVKATDPDLPNIRQAVNTANFDFGPTVVMTAPDDDGIIGLHSRMDIMLHPACPDNAEYVKATLDLFFAAKERVRRAFHKIAAHQAAGQPTAKEILSWHPLNLN